MPDFVAISLAIAVALMVGLLILDVVAHDRVVLSEQAMVPSPVARPSRKRRRLFVLVIVAAVAVVGEGVSLASGGYDPLRAAGPAIGSGPLFVGTAPATYGGVDEVVFTAVPGREIRMEFSLVNSGEFPMTVSGFDNSSGGLASFGYVESGLLMPAGQASGGSGRGAQGRIEIQAHASVRIVAQLRLKNCAEWLPTPTLAPGQSPSAVNAMAATSAFITGGWGTLPVIYDMLGFRHVSNVALPAYLTLAVLDQAGCGGINSSVNLPLGAHATPVPSFQYP